jgi:hypothetical protein
MMIRACDRPAQLAALLRTLADYERRHGARRHYVVLDDSRDVRSAGENAAALAAFAEDTDARTTHVHDDRRAVVVSRLASMVPEAAEALAFAVDTAGWGKGLNLAALLSAGGRYVLLDEDNLLPLKRPPDAEPGLEARWGAEGGTRFFETVEGALDAGVELDEDPFEDALAACGRSLGEAAAAQPELAFDSALEAVAEARVVTVTHGHRGSSCSASSEWMYLLDPGAREPFWRDEAGYRRNLRGESLWYGSRRPFLQPFANFTPFAVDATELLPPTMPDGRGEDRLFGLLIALGDPMTLALHSNLTIGHLQEGDRRRVELLMRPVGPVFNLFVVHVLRDRLGEATEYGGLAARLRAVAAASEEALVAELHTHRQQFLSDLVSRLENAIAAAADPPSYWLVDARRVLELNRRALDSVSPARFVDWPAADEAETLARVRERLDAFATALEAWPPLWEAARDEDLLERVASS